MNRYEVKFWDENGSYKRVQVNAEQYLHAESLVAQMSSPTDVEGSVLLIREVSGKQGVISGSVRLACEDD